MRRASLTPLTHTDFEATKYRWTEVWLPPLRRLPSWGLAVTGLVLRRGPRLMVNAIGGTSRLLATDLARGFGASRKVVALPKVAKGIGLLSLLLPIGLIAISIVLVRQATNPTVAHSAASSRLGDIFTERVSFTAEDGTQLSAVWVPAFTPHDLLVGRDDLLREKRPAIVLVHDYGEDARQMLPAAAELHAMGYHVLALDTRGAGESEAAARTFGQREAIDVAAAVAHLRERTLVDSDRIGAWGLGYGALAVQNADLPAPLSVAVAERAPEWDQDTRFVPAGWQFDLARPVCRWTFSLMHRGGLPPFPSNRALMSVDAPNAAAAMEGIRKAFDPNLSVADIGD